MRSPSVPVCCFYVVLVGLVLSLGSCHASSTESNSTQVSLEDEEDESLSELTLAEFKERYRRLIPYMTFYVANNYINSQASLAPTSAKDPTNSPLLRKNQQYTYTRLITVPRRGGNKYRINPQNQDKKFIPSVQYDPRNVGADNDYFTPVRYGSKINYEDYSAPYQVYQGQNGVYPEITTQSTQITHKENRYFTNVRPLRPYTTNIRDHYSRKPSAKPAQANIQEDYILDYIGRPGGNGATNYPVKEFDGLRYIPAASPYSNLQHQLLEPSPGRQPTGIPQTHRNPNINLNQLVESFQLSERLPEMLNKDNIDNSIKTLVEILNILHSSKKQEFPQLHAPPHSPLGPPPSLPRYPQKLPEYNNYKLRTQTQPKVVTETRFQATPSPLLLTDDPERFKVTSTADDVNLKGPFPPDYKINSLNQEKIVDYYTPYVQDIPEAPREIFKPTVKPHIEDGATEHSYEITEDLSDDILQNEQFTLPITTEGNNYAAPNEVSPQEPNGPPNPPPNVTPHVPQTSLKYGATRGKPNVDYPAYATIPETDFSCKEQRYKGFFGDPATACQVWHYCDLNGGKASFLCPNGTIFSQVALTCDWWFNVKCETTTQLYVLNERLYKYILPIMPKFPEDFTGPEVDRYLEIKFKEMEAKMKEKKLKKQQQEKEKLKDKLQTLDENK